MRLSRTLVAAAVALTFAVTGCSSSESKPTSTVEGAKPYNDADVAFATDMIQHHAQALQMVDMTMGRKLAPKVNALAEDIRMAQAPEIEQMVDLLDEWDNQPIPETSRDHANAHGDGAVEMDTSMPGMMSGEEMEALESTRGAVFESKWLTAMIEHHQGAIRMATTEKDQGEDNKAKALAEDIVEAQGDQVKTVAATHASRLIARGSRCHYVGVACSHSGGVGRLDRRRSHLGARARSAGTKLGAEAAEDHVHESTHGILGRQASCGPEGVDAVERQLVSRHA